MSTDSKMLADAHSRGAHVHLSRPDHEAKALKIGGGDVSSPPSVFHVRTLAHLDRLARLIWSHVHGKPALAAKDLHHAVYRLGSLQFILNEPLWVIGTIRYFGSINLKSTFDRHSLQEVGEYLCSPRILRGLLSVRGRSVSREMSEVLLPLVQHVFALLRPKTPSPVIESDGNAVERFDMRSTHARRTRIHQRREYPSSHIGRPPSALNPLLRLHGKHGTNEGRKNNQTVADGHGDRYWCRGSGTNDVHERIPHTPPWQFGAFCHAHRGSGTKYTENADTRGVP